MKHILRSLARHPRFSISTVLILGGGIALSGGSYAVLESTVWKSLPYGVPSQLVLVGRGSVLHESEFLNLTFPDFEVLSSRARCLEAIGYEVDLGEMVARGSEPPTMVTVGSVSPSLWDVLRVRPALGRSFREDDFEPRSPATVLLSFALWKRLFSGDVKALGEDVEIDDQWFTVIGVMPEAVRRPSTAAELWIPDRTSVANLTERIPDERVFARLRRGISLADAQREVGNFQLVPLWGSRRAGQDRLKIVSLVALMMGRVSLALNVLLGACLLVHFLACFNIGHLMLARRLTSSRTLGIQLALGCGTARLCLEALGEAMALTLAAAVVAVPILLASLRAAVLVTSRAFGLQTHAALSGSVLLFGACLALVSGLVCSVFPVLLLRRFGVASLLNQRLGMEGSFSTSRLQEALIVIQLTMAVVLMTGFGLMAKSVYRLSAVDLGFDASRLSYVVFSTVGSHQPALGMKLDQALDRLARLPAVKSVAIGSTPLLLTPGVGLRIATRDNNGEWTEGQPIHFQAVSGSYFSTLGVPLLAGRTFDQDDVHGSACSAIVNRSLALLFWHSQDALGKQIDLNGGLAPRDPCSVIGVVGDARTALLASPPLPEFYLSYRQRQGAANAVILVKTRSGRYVGPETVRHVVAEAGLGWDSEFSSDVGALVTAAIVPGDTRAKLLGGLALCALLLAASGMYAATTYDLSRRTREIGIRVAMGATAADIAFLIYRRYARLALVGALIGAAAASATSRFAAEGLSLFQVSDVDATIFSLAPLICGFLVLLSVTTPILRVARINAAELLRDDAL